MTKPLVGCRSEPLYREPLRLPRMREPTALRRFDDRDRDRLLDPVRLDLDLDLDRPFLDRRLDLDPDRRDLERDLERDPDRDRDPLRDLDRRLEAVRREPLLTLPVRRDLDLDLGRDGERGLDIRRLPPVKPRLADRERDRDRDRDRDRERDRERGRIVDAPLILGSVGKQMSTLQ